ncbi:hypothetical protein, partial [Desulfovibrio inopinatus]|uniref:hypothetical protein n=1 Tax=Desulfovibrio inopinatus TaxID=102109 RepID=UPI000557C02A
IKEARLEWERDRAADFTTYLAKENELRAKDYATNEKDKQELWKESSEVARKLSGQDLADEITHLQAMYQELQTSVQDRNALDVWYYQELDKLRVKVAESNMDTAGDFQSYYEAWLEKNLESAKTASEQEKAIHADLAEVQAEVTGVLLQDKLTHYRKVVEAARAAGLDVEAVERSLADEVESIYEEMLDAKIANADSFGSYLQLRIAKDLGLYKSATTQQAEYWDSIYGTLSDGASGLWDTATEGLSSWLSALRQGGDEAQAVWADMLDSMLDMLIQTITQMMITAAQNYVIVPIMGQFLGVDGESSGLLDFLSSDEGGIGDLIKDVGNISDFFSFGGASGGSADVGWMSSGVGSVAVPTGSEIPTGMVGDFGQSVSMTSAGSGGGSASALSTIGGLGSGAFTGAGIGYGLSSLVYPNGTATTGGTVGGALGGAAGAALSSAAIMGGAALGSWAGPVGALIGAAIGILATGGETTTTSWTSKNEQGNSPNIAITIVNGEPVVTGYSTLKNETSGAFGSSSTEHVRVDDYIDPAVRTEVEEIFDGIFTDLENNLTTLGISTEGLDTLDFSNITFDTTAEELESVLDNFATLFASTQLQDVGMYDAVTQYQDADHGELLPDTLTRLAESFELLTETTRLANINVEALTGTADTLAQADWASRAIDAVGGIDAFGEAIALLSANTTSSLQQLREGTTQYYIDANEALTELGFGFDDVYKSGEALDTFWARFRGAMSQTLDPEIFAQWVETATAVSNYEAMQDSWDAGKEQNAAYFTGLDSRQLDAQGMGYTADATNYALEAEQALSQARRDGYDAAQMEALAATLGVEKHKALADILEEMTGQVDDGTSETQTFVDELEALLVDLTGAAQALGATSDELQSLNDAAIRIKQQEAAEVMSDIDDAMAALSRSDTEQWLLDLGDTIDTASEKIRILTGNESDLAAIRDYEAAAIAGQLSTLMDDVLDQLDQLTLSDVDYQKQGLEDARQDALEMAYLLGATADQIAHINQLYDLQIAKIEEAGQALDEWTVFDQDLNSRLLHAQSTRKPDTDWGTRADVYDMMASQEKELADARAAGADATQIAKLETVQYAEVLAAEAQTKQALEDAEEAYQDALDQLEQTIVQIETEKLQKELEGLQEQFDAMADSLNDMTSDMVDSSSEMADAARESADAYHEAASSLRDTVENLMYGDASPLSPEELVKQLGAKFDDLYSKGMAGDIDALRELGTAGTEYAAALQDYYASGEGYTTAHDDVTSKMLEASLVSDAMGVSADYQADLLDMQVALLQQIQDEIAKGDQANIEAINGAVAALEVVQELLDASMDIQVSFPDVWEASFQDQSGQLADLAAMSAEQAVEFARTHDVIVEGNQLFSSVEGLSQDQITALNELGRITVDEQGQARVLMGQLNDAQALALEGVGSVVWQSGDAMSTKLGQLSASEIEALAAVQQAAGDIPGTVSVEWERISASSTDGVRAAIFDQSGQELSELSAMSASEVAEFARVHDVVVEGNQLFSSVEGLSQDQITALNELGRITVDEQGQARVLMGQLNDAQAQALEGVGSVVWSSGDAMSAKLGQLSTDEIAALAAVQAAAGDIPGAVSVEWERISGGTNTAINSLTGQIVEFGKINPEILEKLKNPVSLDEAASTYLSGIQGAAEDKNGELHNLTTAYNDVVSAMEDRNLEIPDETLKAMQDAVDLSAVATSFSSSAGQFSGAVVMMGNNLSAFGTDAASFGSYVTALDNNTMAEDFGANITDFGDKIGDLKDALDPFIETISEIDTIKTEIEINEDWLQEQGWEQSLASAQQSAEAAKKARDLADATYKVWRAFASGEGITDAEIQRMLDDVLTEMGQRPDPITVPVTGNWVQQIDRMYGDWEGVLGYLARTEGYAREGRNAAQAARDKWAYPDLGAWWDRIDSASVNAQHVRNYMQNTERTWMVDAVRQ